MPVAATRRFFVKMERANFFLPQNALGRPGPAGAAAPALYRWITEFPCYTGEDRHGSSAKAD